MKPIVIVALFFFLAEAFGQAIPGEKRDTLSTSYLDEVIISANKIPEQRRTVAQQINVITTEAIKFQSPQTTADLLQNTGVVSVQKSQQGGGSPILRGFEASRVLLMVDGVRMNNLIYRAGHLQNAITMDNNMLDRAEILFGPSSTMYGSDALGGVVHFYTRNPELSGDKKIFVSGNTVNRLSTVNREKTSHVDFTISGKKFGSLSSFTYSDFGDLRMGKKINPSLNEEFGLRPFYAQRNPDNTGDLLIANPDRFVQKFSGYKQYDFLQKFLFRPSENTEHILNFQFSTSTNIPRYDRLTDPQGTGLRFAEWYYGPQKRLMGSYQLKIKNLGAFADAFSATASFQSIEESRHDRRFDNNNFNHRTEDATVFGLSLDFNKNRAANKWRYGFDSQFNFLSSTAYRENISTNAISSLDTRYPDGTNALNNIALYATHTWEINKLWTLNDGLRVGRSSLNATFLNKTFFSFPFDEINQENMYGSGNLGIIFTPSSWKFSLTTSTGYRVPNIDDLAKVFESVAGTATTTGTLAVPNPQLKPEKTINADLAVTKFIGNQFRLEGLVFATRFFEAIAVRPSSFNGQESLVYNGFPANIVSSQNVSNAMLFGWNAQLHWEPLTQLVFVASYNFTLGQVIESGQPNTPLDHIAPAFGRVSAKYSFDKVRVECFGIFSGKKQLSDYSNSGEDNLQYAPVTGMPSWWAANMRASYEINKWFTLQAGIDNLFDLQYRTFASGINAPGRNFFGALVARF